MLIDALLRRLVVIAGHTEGGIRADLLGEFRQLYRLKRVVGASARDDGDALLRHLDTDFDDALMFRMAERGRLARRAAAYEPTRVLGHLTCTQFGQRPRHHLPTP